MMSLASHGVIKNRAPENQFDFVVERKKYQIISSDKRRIYEYLILSIGVSIKFLRAYKERLESNVVRKGIFVVAVQGFFLHLITCR